jgi:uncharacterized protein (DUF2147 family)
MTKTRKNWRAIGLALLALTPGLAQAADPDPVGNWLRANRTVRIAVTPCGNDFCAVNTWVKRPKGNEHAGDKLILDMKRISPTEFRGKAYDVRRQRTYSMTVTFQGDTMVTSGCVLFGIICKSTGWTRIN